MSCTLTFTGDIMCQIPQTAACTTAHGYDYSPVFRHVRALLSGGDYLVGNLETPIAGKQAGLSSAMYAFNTPIEFAEELRRVGFDLVSTANNHCMDRGIEGLYATLDSLDKVGLAHVGTARTPKERETPFIREIGGIRVGFVAYTYGTNAFAHHTFLQPGEEHAVNLFMPEETLEGSIHLLDEDTIPALTQAYYGQKSEVFDRCIAPHLRQMAGDVTRLRENGAQFIVFIMHSGGQYNPLPEAYTLELARRIRETGVDLIVGHHPHVIHPMPVEDGCPTAYSLGNFSYTPNFSPVGAGKRAEYSVVLRVDLEKQSEDKAAIAAMRFALCKSVFNRNGSTCVMTIPQLLAEAADEQERAALLRDNQFFVNKFRCTPEDTPVEVQDWYEV